MTEAKRIITENEYRLMAEILTLLADYRKPGEDWTDTVGRLLEEREHLRLCARRYINAVDGDQEPNLYIAFKAALGEPVV